MRKLGLVVALCLVSICHGREYPDLGGIPRITQPNTVKNRVFILTNPKSGSHLLMYSIMKLMNRPVRGRVPYWHYENDPPFFTLPNPLNLPISFEKQTVYWGHEYNSLPALNHSHNKLIMTLKNYKETICSQIFLREKKQIPNNTTLWQLLQKEVLGQGLIFREFMLRLKTFDEWSEDNRCLIDFEDLLHHPETFAPQLLQFLEDDSDPDEFIAHYGEFKKEVRAVYDKKSNGTGTGSNSKHFSEQMPTRVLQRIDRYVQFRYPKLWDKYLSRFSDL